VRHELGFYTPEERIVHCHRRENLKSYTVLAGWALYTDVRFSVRHELGFYTPEDGILHSHAAKSPNLTYYITVNNVKLDGNAVNCHYRLLPTRFSGRGRRNSTGRILTFFRPS
jgi:hypothetical protein